MDTLFPIQLKFPEGFLYVPDFITQEEELILVEQIKNIPLHTFQFQGFEAKRKTASFGYDYHFDNRTLVKSQEIPHNFHWVIEKVASYLSMSAAAFVELLITEYPIGSVINWHRDAFPFQLIAGISLSSACIFKLRPHQKEKQSRSSILSVPVQRRSLYILQGISRSEWQHSIAPVKSIRYSITLRTLL